MINKNQILEAIESMSVMDIMELIDSIEKKFNISSDTTTLGSSSLEKKIEEKTEFNVVLKAIGNNKIAVIKVVRSAMGLGLKESKDLVESAPVVLKEKISKEDAISLEKSLKETGAEIEIQ